MTTSRHGESYVLLDGEVVIGQGTDTDLPPCEPGPAVERIAGSNRYATAATLALRFWQHAEFVYLASGDAFPDALAAAGIPDNEQGPVLLVTRDTLPPETAEALAALGPVAPACPRRHRRGQRRHDGRRPGRRGPVAAQR